MNEDAPFSHQTRGGAPDWLKEDAFGSFFDFDFEAEAYAEMLAELLGDDDTAEFVDREFHGN